MTAHQTYSFKPAAALDTSHLWVMHAHTGQRTTSVQKFTQLNNPNSFADRKALHSARVVRFYIKSTFVPKHVSCKTKHEVLQVTRRTLALK